MKYEESNRVERIKIKVKKGHMGMRIGIDKKKRNKRENWATATFVYRTKHP